MASNCPSQNAQDLGAKFPANNTISPINGSIVTERVQNLSWNLNYPSSEGIIYYVHLGTSPENLIEIGPTKGNWFELYDLESGVTYYWRITVYIPGIEGKSASDIFTFTIQEDFVPVHDIALSFATDSLELVQGDSTMVNLTICNVGNMATTINLSVIGELIGYVTFSFDRSVELDVNDDYNLTMMLFANLKLEPKTYELVVMGKFVGKEVSARINVTIKKESSVNNHPSESLPWLWFVVSVILLAAIIGLLLLVLRKRSTGGEEKEDNFIHAEIEMKPWTGITSSEISHLEFGSAMSEPIQGRLSEMSAPLPLEYTLPIQVGKQTTANQQRTAAFAPQVTLPQLEMHGNKDEHPLQ